MAIAGEHLRGYLPMQLGWNAALPSGLQVDWCFAGEHALQAPFFDDAIAALLRQPFNQLFRPRTDSSQLEKVRLALPCLVPSAFIFHLSRCGSTLLSQMFAASTKNIVVSEAPGIDRILSARQYFPAISEQQQQAWLRDLIGCLGQQRAPHFSRYIIKFDSWHTRFIPLIQKVFPDVPWVFLYRDPLEVLVSNLTQRAAHTLPGVAHSVVEGVSLLESVSMSAEQYTAMLLGQTMRHALAQSTNPNGLLVNYCDFPQHALPQILAHFQIAPTPAEYAQMHEATRMSAKRPGTVFSPDSAQKRQQASALAREISAHMLMPYYEQLEQIRWRA